MKPNLLNKTTLLSTLALFFFVVFSLQSCKEENQPPVVQITTPSQGEVIAIGDEVTISADADDPEDNIKEVRFYVDNVGIGSATAFPYTATWSTEDKEAGSYTLKATVEDEEGEEASDEVTVSLEQGDIAPEAAFSATLW